MNGEKAPVVKNALSELGKPDAGPLIQDIMPGSQVRSYSMPVRRHGGAKRRPARDNGLADSRPCERTGKRREGEAALWGGGTRTRTESAFSFSGGGRARAGARRAPPAARPPDAANVRA